jgi:mycothiol synthase
VVTIRPITPDDYAGIAQVNNHATPENMQSEESLRHADLIRDPVCKTAYWVAEIDSTIVGFSSYIQYLDEYHPQKFYVSVKVDPAYQRQGIGTALYETMLAGVQAHDPLELKLSIREDYPDALRFAMKRGFQEIARRWGARLDLHTFDPGPLLPYIETVEAQGIIFRSAAGLIDDPDRDSKLNDLKWEIEQDVPFPGTLTPTTLDRFRQEVIGDPRFQPDTSLVALDGTSYVGLTLMFLLPSGELYIDLTGTSRDYRRRGVAMALKLRGILAAQSGSFKTMLTTNDPGNDGILAINEKLGFVRDPAEIVLIRKFSDAS